MMMLARVLAVLSAGLLSTVACLAQTRPEPAGSRPPAVIGVISGSLDGTYARIAADLAAVLDDGAQLRVLPMLGKGSVQNINDILHLRGVDVGIVQSDVLSFMRQQGDKREASRSIDYIAKLYNEEVHVLAAPGIGSLDQLNGRKVNVDVRGSGTALTAATMFGGLGLTPALTYDDQATALDKLQHGGIDALVYVAGKPVRLFTGIPPGTGLHLLPVQLTAALAESYLPSRLDAADYPILIEDGGGVETIAVGAVMAVFNWPRNSERYAAATRFTEAFFTSMDQFRRAPRHPKWREVNLGAQVPGWTRFPPAAAWLQQHRQEAGQP